MTGSLAASSAFLGIAGGIVLAVLAPFDQQRALDLDLGRSTAVTRYVVTYQDLPPIPTSPPVTVFAGQQPLPTPRLPTRIPIVRIERVPAQVDPELAFSLMRYWTSAAIGSVGIAVLLLLVARSIRGTPS